MVGSGIVGIWYGRGNHDNSCSSPAKHEFFNV